MSTITIEKEEYNTLLKRQKDYFELSDTFEALQIAEKEEDNKSLKKLWSLKDLM